VFLVRRQVQVEQDLATIAQEQIETGQEQARTQFEDDLAREYREIAQRIPVKALLGEELNDKEYAAALDSFYHYIDLSNTQIFLRQEGRVSLKTWESWCEGIAWNLSLPAFCKAWAEIGPKTERTNKERIFRELRQLECNEFEGDPHDPDFWES
jgi:hypothetical protein